MKDLGAGNRRGSFNHYPSDCMQYAVMTNMQIADLTGVEGRGENSIVHIIGLS